jgi:hypothetical protein
VDTQLFSQDERFDYGLPRPVWIYMGRVAVEKNIEAFLDLDRDGCRAFVEDRSWRRSTPQFESYLAPRTRATADAQPDSSASR